MSSTDKIKDITATERHTFTQSPEPNNETLGTRKVEAPAFTRDTIDYTNSRK